MKNPLQTLAGRFGLSQQQLAGFLSVHRSMISHINNSTKLLPNNSLAQLRHLMTLDLNNSRMAKKTTRQMTTATADAGTIAQVTDITRSLEIKLRITQNQLTVLQQQWHQCIKTAAFCASLREESIDLKTKQQRWLEELEYRNGKMQAKCSPDEQLLLSLQVQAVKAPSNNMSNSITGLSPPHWRIPHKTFSY